VETSHAAQPDDSFAVSDLLALVSSPSCRQPAAKLRPDQAVLNSDERNLLLAGLFELRLTRSAFDDDPDAAGRPIVEQIQQDAINALVAKLGG
jgi:hypothetical protein